MKLKKSIAALGMLLLATTAAAQPIIMSNSILQQQIDIAAQADGFADSGIDVENDQVNPDEIWSFNNRTFSSAAYLFSFEGNNNDSSSFEFGIYDLLDTNNKIALNPEDGVFDAVSVIFNNGNVTVSDPVAMVLINSGTLSSSNFGFYLDYTSGQNTYTAFSQSELNPGEKDHMVTYWGGATSNNWLTQAQYLLAFDATNPNPNRDFDDYVVVVESLNRVPVPSTIGILGLAIFALAAGRRIKR